MGVFGEYLGRMYEQTKGRPLFIVEEIVRTDKDGDPERHVENGRQEKNPTSAASVSSSSSSRNYPQTGVLCKTL